MMRLVRSAFVIARRDFAATVLSKAFIFFLLGPLFPLLLGGVFGSIGAQVASRTERPAVAVVASPADFAPIATSRARLADAIGDDQLVEIAQVDPAAAASRDPAVILAHHQPAVSAVLFGLPGAPHLVGPMPPDDPLVGQVRLILAGASSRAPPLPDLAMVRTQGSTASLAHDQATTAQIGQMLLFFLTILLSGMVLSQLIEEKSNKIIEVIAAAVPIDALFVGKLFAMLAASVLGIVVWISAGALLIQLVKHGGVHTLPPPAVGWPAFLLLCVLYFATNYLLLGAVFLMIGAQASTVREVQTLSMPVTFAQVIVFGFAATTVGAPGSPEAIAAAIFPLSSPMAMLARAAEQPQLWPHLAALVWQLAWIALILRFGAMLFRKTVLKSGPRSPWWRFGRA